MPDIFVEAKPQVFGWGKLLTEIVTVVRTPNFSVPCKTDLKYCIH